MTKGRHIIQRVAGIYRGHSKSSLNKDLIWTIATSPDLTLDLAGQTKMVLNVIEENLRVLESDKTHILSAQVYIADMAKKSEMDAVWCEWIGEDPAHWPQRACLGVALEGKVLVEVTVTAARNC